MFDGRKEILEALEKLGRRLVYSGSLDDHEILVCGGAALVYHRYIDRATKDVDVLCVLQRDENNEITQSHEPSLPPDLEEAAGCVAREMGLPWDWLNNGPFPLQKTMGLPEGIHLRAESKDFGPSLRVYFLGRQDAISLKLFAALDRTQSPRHFKDIEALKPSQNEIDVALQWILGRRYSVQFLAAVTELVTVLGYSLGDISNLQTQHSENKKRTQRKR